MPALRVAAIGAGGGAVAHFEAAQRSGAFEFVGVLDVDADRARTQATHPLYVLRWLLGDVAGVTATRGASTLDMTGEDTAAVTVSFRSGAVASLIATSAAALGPGDHAIRLFGTAGTLTTALRHGTHERPERLHGVLSGHVGDSEWHELPLPPSQGWITSLQRMWEDCAHAIHAGAPAQVSGEDGREVVRVVRAANASIDRGSAVVLPTPANGPPSRAGPTPGR